MKIHKKLNKRNNSGRKKLTSGAEQACIQCHKETEQTQVNCNKSLLSVKVEGHALKVKENHSSFSMKSPQKVAIWSNITT